MEERTGGALVSTYIDASGQAAVVEQSLDLLALYGEVILLGSPRAPHETNLTAHLQHFHNLPWCQTMKGALEFTFPTHQNGICETLHRKKCTDHPGPYIAGKTVD